ncbi:AMIN domain-containing protein [Candidatus Magnetomonas plexicatena]|uniref:AMIN domain-containing protein n=1 Tax=Candidatus Magnetomonas plexicatena TaxID=2552947 RepID=UPI0011053B01|nr:AMIN domain-containing protein [Nitrospirales bacterium LBB_01]
MAISKKAVLASLVLFLFFGCASVKKDSGGVEQNTITSIDVSGLSINVVLAKPFMYETLPQESKSIRSVYLPGVSAGTFNGKTITGGEGSPTVSVVGMKSLASDNITPSDDSTLEISYIPGFSIKTLSEGNILNIKIHQVEKADNLENTSTGSITGKSITGLDLKQTDGTLVLGVKGDGSLVPDVFSLDGRIVVDIPGVRLSKIPKLSVQSPIKGIRYWQHKDKVRFVLDLTDKVKYDVQLHSNGFSVRLYPNGKAEMTAASKAESESLHKEPIVKGSAAHAPDFKDHLISLDFVDADVVSVIRLISEVSGANIVLDHGVGGKITIKLRDLPWQKALDLVLETTHLIKTITDDNTIRISNPASQSEKSSAEETAGRPIIIKDLNITLTGLGGGTKTIRRTNITAENGKLTLDLNVTVDSAKHSAKHPVKSKVKKNKHSRKKR